MKPKSSRILDQKAGSQEISKGYVRRPMLAVPGSEAGNGPKLSIMTYNVLAQALINRKRYPTSGTALRWVNRSKAMFKEIGDYNPDICCLQEVDVATWESEWRPKLQEQGYHAIFHASRQKKHGIAIAFKSQKFTLSSHMLVDYDSELTAGMERFKITDNIALFVYLTFRTEFLQGFLTPSKNGIIVGTTHLYWHAFASYERTRQAYILLQSSRKFTRNTRTLFGENLSFYTYIAGDFNSQPFDAAYLSMTEKPIEFEGITKNGLGRSIAYDWIGPTDLEDEDPDPEQFNFEDHTLKQISDIQDLHNSVSCRAISLYSVAYKSVHPENAGLDNDKNEPLFSNWTDTWKGLIDYICVICDWELTDNKSVDTLRDFAKVSKMRILKLLQMPAKDDMGAEQLGLPQPESYPSDHLCMMAELELI